MFVRLLRKAFMSSLNSLNFPLTFKIFPRAFNLYFTSTSQSSNESSGNRLVSIIADSTCLFNSEKLPLTTFDIFFSSYHDAMLFFWSQVMRCDSVGLSFTVVDVAVASLKVTKFKTLCQVLISNVSTCHSN